MRKIVIIVEPVAGRPGYFAAALDGVGLCISREPLLSAARELIRRGVSPDTILAMRHAGSDHDALRGRLGALAMSTIADNRHGTPVLRRWKGPPGVVQAPPVRRPSPELPHASLREARHDR